MTFRKPEPFALLFIVATTALLLALGGWQVQRLMWKNALIAQIEAAQAAPTLHAWQPDAYRRIEIEGTFLHDKSLRMVGRPQGTSLGFYILTPLQLEGGDIVLVNRGWAPDKAELTLPGAALITGVVRPARVKRPFTPDNQPEKNVWFFEDIDAMSKATGMALAPMVIEAVGKGEAGVYPLPGDGKISLRNDHLGYAITWFSLAAIGLVMFAIYYRKTEKNA